MTCTPPRPLPPPRYEARNTDGSAGSRHLSRLDAVLSAVVTIRLRGGGLQSGKLLWTTSDRGGHQQPAAHRQQGRDQAFVLAERPGHLAQRQRLRVAVGRVDHPPARQYVVERDDPAAALQ